MSLSYLTGDDYTDIGKSKKKSSGGGGGSSKKAAKKQTKQAKKTNRKATQAAKKTTKKANKPAKKAAKKENRKRVFKKVAKVAVAPARAAFLSVCKLNLLKISTKIARAWKSGGKDDIIKFWSGFGGDINALKKAVNQGAKDNISGDNMGAVAAATIIATATPIIAALVPIIKKFKAAGSEEEAAEFNEGYDEGRKKLADDDSVPKSSVSMPNNKESGVVVDKNGDAQEDEKQSGKAKPESESGGTDSDSDEGEKKKTSSGSGGGGALDEGGAEDEKGDAATKAKKEMASNFSPLGLFFMTIMYIMNFKLTGIFFELIALYCTIGMILIPFSKYKIARAISYAPINLINSVINQTKIKWQRNPQ